MKQSLQHPSLHRATRQSVYFEVNLIDGLYGVAFKIVAAVVAIDNYQLGVEAFSVTRITLLQHTTKRGWDRDPTLIIHLMMAFASKSARHWGLPHSLLGVIPLRIKTAD